MDSSSQEEREEAPLLSIRVFARAWSAVSTARSGAILRWRAVNSNTASPAQHLSHMRRTRGTERWRGRASRAPARPCDHRPPRVNRQSVIPAIGEPHDMPQADRKGGMENLIH
eukprot:scaffold13249_cov118-Isochrysis_galbana.AAC.2